MSKDDGRVDCDLNEEIKGNNLASRIKSGTIGLTGCIHIAPVRRTARLSGQGFGHTVGATSVTGSEAALIGVGFDRLFERSIKGLWFRQGMARVLAMDGHMSVVTAEIFCTSSISKHLPTQWMRWNLHTGSAKAWNAMMAR
jgi:hypothetical protein